jgi:hypothetical protein
MFALAVEEVVEEGFALTDIDHCAPGTLTGQFGEKEAADLALRVDSFVINLHNVCYLIILYAKIRKKDETAKFVLKFLNVYRCRF